jgi:fumarate hydratase class II
MADEKFRIEQDSLGEVSVPQDAYWGASTQRALANFPISGRRFPRGFIHALGLVKKAAAETNVALGLLEPKLAEAIRVAGEEVMEGKWDAQFVVDVFQTGSGTSTNMNANEVIANRANELLGADKGKKHPVHPNDHVNSGQSSNDVIPTCIHVSALESVETELLPALRKLHSGLDAKSREFHDIVKTGRTHLQDATPVRLGQEFGGYAHMVERGIRRVEGVREGLSELALGGTAVGTGLNTHPEFARRAIEAINEATGLSFREAENHFEAQGARDALVETSGVLKVVAVSLMKIANDIRWLGSGPRCSIGELILPEVQPGSSIMPGKVNPVIPEAVCMVSAQVIGYDASITVAGMSGNFELNVMLPLLAHNILEAIGLLSNASLVFNDKCIRDLRANVGRITMTLEQSIALATALAPAIGYDAAARIAKEAHATGKTVREVAMSQKVLPADELERLLDPASMTSPRAEA